MADNIRENDIGYMIKNLNEILEKKANEDLRQWDLTLSQLRVMGFIISQKQAESTQKEIEDFLQVSHPTVNGILKRLEAKGRISAELSVNRRLTKRVRLTEKGRAECGRIDASRLQHESLLASKLSDSERKTLLALLRKVQQGLTEN